jgi:hypothetical protein
MTKLKVRRVKMIMETMMSPMTRFPTPPPPSPEPDEVLAPPPHQELRYRMPEIHLPPPPPPPQELRYRKPVAVPPRKTVVFDEFSKKTIFLIFLALVVGFFIGRSMSPIHIFTTGSCT